MGLMVTGINGRAMEAYGASDGGVRGPPAEGSDESDQEGEGVEGPVRYVFVSSEKRTCLPGIVVE
jgi:hypothetical protein